MSDVVRTSDVQAEKDKRKHGRDKEVFELINDTTNNEGGGLIIFKFILSPFGHEFIEKISSKTWNTLV